MDLRQDCPIQLSLIVPAYNENDNIVPFYTAAVAAFEAVSGICEIVFVDDGSSDGTYQSMEQVVKENSQHSFSRVVVQAVSFSRNFGKEAAMLAGLRLARGKYCCFIDSDLQQRPETAVEMYELLRSNPEYDCVAACQESRAVGLTSCLSEKFYGLLAKFSGLDVLENASDFRVFTRQVSDALTSLPESYRFTKGLFAWIGFKTLPYTYAPDDRYSGETTWTFKKLVSYALNGLLSFSTLPLKFATYFGLIVSLAAFVYLFVVVIQRLIYRVDIPGYATIVVLILFLGGVQLLVLGIIGEYLARVYEQGKQRPIYIIRAATRSDDTSSNCSTN